MKGGKDKAKLFLLSTLKFSEQTESSVEVHENLPDASGPAARISLCESSE